MNDNEGNSLPHYNYKDSTLNLYNNVTEMIASSDNKWLNFMNHGYYPPYPFLDKELVLKNSASLYLNVLKNIDTSEKKLLDIGCGRGGGVEIYNKYLEFKSIDACDLTPVSIDYCKSTQPNINFKVCDAESLDYEDCTFDIVTNVESSHCYSDLNSFYKEVHRVLKPTGIFCYADVFDNHNKDRKFALYDSNYFSKIETRDITKNVLDSCDDFLSNTLHNFNNPLKDFYQEQISRQAYFYRNKMTSFKVFICRI